MMRSAWLFVVAAGCTHHYDITEAHEVAGEEVEVSGQYGASVEAVGVAGNGGITFYDKQTGGLVPAEEIYRVKDVRHVRGAIEGLGIGAGVGAGLGAIIGLASGDDECGNTDHGCYLSLTAEGKAVVAGVLLGALGGFVGLLTGAVKGSTIIYERPSAQPAVTLVGPPGSAAGITVKF